MHSAFRPALRSVWQELALGGVKTNKEVVAFGHGARRRSLGHGGGLILRSGESFLGMCLQPLLSSGAI